jgi:predicted ATP-dependent protease
VQRKFVIIAPTEHEVPPKDIDAVELLIKEARRKARRRRLSIATSLALALVLLFGLITTVLRGPGT